MVADERPQIDLSVVEAPTPHLAASLVINPRPQRVSLSLRSMPGASRSTSVRCDNGDAIIGPGSWLLPPGCRTVTWRIPLARLDSGYDPATQFSALAPTGEQVLVFEWGVLPRVSDRPAPRVCLRHGGGDVCRVLPEIDRPPLILAAGFAPAAHGEWGTLFLDRREGAALTEAAAGFGRQVEQLAQLLGPVGEPLALLWLARDPKALSLGGVAGSGLILANYPAGNLRATDAGLLLARWISAHEAVHVMGRTRAPLWAAESLAHYLGYRSLAHDVGLQQASELWNRFMAGPEPDVSLPELGARAEAGDSFARIQIYLAGARFWAAVEALLAQSPAERSRRFESLLHSLNQDSWPAPNRFPEAACAVLSRHAPDHGWHKLAAGAFEADPCSGRAARAPQSS